MANCRRAAPHGAASFYSEGRETQGQQLIGSLAGHMGLTPVGGNRNGRGEDSRSPEDVLEAQAFP